MLFLLPSQLSIPIGAANIEDTIDCKPISKRGGIKFIILVSTEALSVPVRLKVAAIHFNFPRVVVSRAHNSCRVNILSVHICCSTRTHASPLNFNFVFRTFSCWPN